jgi:plasmid stabilization system protein ParE
MSAQGLVPWIYEDDPDARLAMADQVLREMQSLAEHPGWLRLQQVLNQKITAGRDEMERTGRNVDLLRGAVRAVREIKGLPEYAIERAHAELSLHRGE